MAITNQEFQTIIDQIEETVKETIQQELSVFAQQHSHLVEDLPEQPRYPNAVDLVSQIDIFTHDWVGRPLPNHIVIVRLQNFCGNPSCPVTGGNPQNPAYIFQRPDELYCPYCLMFRGIRVEYQQSNAITAPNNPAQPERKPFTF